jgi:hypothetical protein
LLSRVPPELPLLPRQDLLLLRPLDVRVRLDVEVRLHVRVDGPLAHVRTPDQVDVVEDGRWKTKFSREI